MLYEYVCEKCGGILSIDQKNNNKTRCGFCGKKELIIKTGGKVDEPKTYSQTDWDDAA